MPKEPGVVTLSICLPRQLWDQIDERASRGGISRSRQINNDLERLIAMEREREYYEAQQLRRLKNAAKRSITTLDMLYHAMLANDARVLDQHGQWLSDMPTFGGSEPEDTRAVWSWDETRLLLGTCTDDLEIVDRQ